MSGPHEDVEKENTSLRKKLQLLREETELLKKRQSTDQQGITKNVPRGVFVGQNPLSCIFNAREGVGGVVRTIVTTIRWVRRSSNPSLSGHCYALPRRAMEGRTDLAKPLGHTPSG
jgi:hypothetical protein